MAKTVYLLQFNNYFNRTLKGPYSRVDDYTYNGGTIVAKFNPNLWNTNDGVTMTATSPLQLYAIPDYCIVEEDNVVTQRWFVLEAVRIQNGQWTLNLKRDLIAENYTEIINNTDTFVERGWCDNNNPAIYNQEPMTYNQVKFNQRSLYDISQCPWIVLYFTPTKTVSGTETNFPEKTVSWKYNNQTYTMKVTFNTVDKTSVDGDGYTQGLTQSDQTPYAIAVMPYATRDYYLGDLKLGTTELRNNLACAMAISRAYSSSGWLMDMQLLPYCPCREVLRSDGNIDLSKALSFAPIVEGAARRGALISCKDATFAATLYTSTKQVFKHTVTNVKLDNLTVKCRLVSPNGNGVFEFNPAKMVYADDAQIGFEAYCTYMPYQPYIRVAPHYARLYGEEFGDYRGLICGGDFSLPQINDSWEAYQVQNKNYQSMFNRQIDSLELQQNIGLAQDIVGSIAGVAAAGAAGATFGQSAMVGFAGASIAGGSADILTNQMLRADQKSNMIFQHNKQLDNIKSLPLSVTKVNNFNIDNTYVPYLEIYNCTDEETENLYNYLQLYSYSINRVGKLYDYVKATGRTFLKGIIVRLSGVTDDSHYLASIADEVNQGFYIEKGTTS